MIFTNLQGSNPSTFTQTNLTEGIMRVFVVTYDTVYAYSDGISHKGIEGVYSSQELAEQHIADRKRSSAYNDTSYDIDEYEVI
jgi:hypothetical protein